FLPHKSGGKKEIHFTDFEGKTSFGMSVFNLSNAIMGSGILGLAFAMSNTGVILFIILLVFIAILSAYSIHLLLKSAGVIGIRAYEQLGNRAFGTKGKILAAFVITVHNVGAMSSYLFIVKSELPLVIQAFLGKQENTGEWFLDGNYLVIIVSIVIILPLALMKQLGMFSLRHHIFFIYLFLMPPLPTIMSSFETVLTVISLPNANVSFVIDRHQNALPNDTDVHSDLNGTEHVCEAKLFTINSQTAYTIPILAFAFVCHPEVLPIYTELRDATKKRMQKVANISILAMFTMYLLTALFGYLTFFGAVEPELLHTYSKVDALDVLILCVRLAVLVAVTLTVPVVLFPIRRAVLQTIWPDKPFHWAKHIGIAFGLIVIVNILVIFVPSIRDIFGLIGATSAPSLIFILPGIFYLRIVPSEQEPLLSRPKIQVQVSSLSY
uniref:Sodium-coupled neutral amino acid transporter 3-like n=1 Tax=Mastacembelus armatus TaxID=205130 RepID=A0A7N8YNJ7_9TELE